MGLDMYLTAKRYVSEYQDQDVTLSNELKQRFPELREGESIAWIEVRVGCWRKANAIHKWFVDHVQEGEDECRPHYVSKNQLQALREACLDALKNKKRAVDILPSAGGFFFGSTEYDEWYFKDLEYTVKVMDRALELAETGNWDMEYLSSW